MGLGGINLGWLPQLNSSIRNSDHGIEIFYQWTSPPVTSDSGWTIRVTRNGTWTPIPTTLLGWNLDAWTTFFKTAVDTAPEFREGGCARVFFQATGGALNPLSPSLATVAEPAVAAATASKYNAALDYAAAQPNYLGGRGLVYPMKSSTFRGMLSDAKTTAASGLLVTLDLAEVQGIAVEMNALASGRCH
jgi:hypothetical protein